ncbi:recombination protein RecO [Nitrosophilus alvini]|uniref:recombination protein RecO n=1 Tax=Nitrosophilus alvini TaxID=2714855 RepID=UPI00190E1FF1|nr:recombination protein RecO [Nitrosophilus alvini]
MQGFILKTTRAKNEDIIVTVLTEKKIVTLYRFYGARHSIINLGYKIDFETEFSQKAYLPRLRNVTHLGYNWLKSQERFMLWQQFIVNFFEHLKDATEIDSFYFNLINNAATLWGKQNPKRTAVECYIKILQHEGRLHSDNYCFVCNRSLNERISLVRGFLPAHPLCVHSKDFDAKTLNSLFTQKTTLFLDDESVAHLWNIMLEGF